MLFAFKQCGPCNGGAQSGMQPKASRSRRSHVSPKRSEYAIIACLVVNQGFNIAGNFTAFGDFLGSVQGIVE